MHVSAQYQHLRSAAEVIDRFRSSAQLPGEKVAVCGVSLAAFLLSATNSNDRNAAWGCIYIIFFSIDRRPNLHRSMIAELADMARYLAYDSQATRIALECQAPMFTSTKIAIEHVCFRILQYHSDNALRRLSSRGST
jgi:hypothetical protein